MHVSHIRFWTCTFPLRKMLNRVRAIGNTLPKDFGRYFAATIVLLEPPVRIPATSAQGGPGRIETARWTRSIPGNNGGFSALIPPIEMDRLCPRLTSDHDWRTGPPNERHINRP